ncbi:hypothetical protein TNCV_287461 [Trichonephila clavipes]|nr:hypothetical protein TNCV_287461 [Trichonephila clavipes]
MAEKDNLEFVQSSKNIDAVSDEENVMNNVTPVPMSSDMRNIIKSMRCYLDTYSNGEMNNNMDNIEQLVDNLMLKHKAKKNIRVFS